jgi:hypothetical protein
MKYRIIKRGEGLYYVEYRRWWAAFWGTYYWRTGGGWGSVSATLEEAKRKLERLKTHGRGDLPPVVVHEE